MADQQEAESSRAPEQTQETSQPSAGQSMERAPEAETSIPVRREQYAPSGPFSLMRRISEDMDRVFSDFFGQSLFRWPSFEGLGGLAAEETFWPQVEVQHEGNKLVIQADVPGLKREDINVEVRGDELRIWGERRSEAERSERGYYRSERSYGSFLRTIELPEGTKPETASASFENGVLRIEMEAPSESTQGKGRRIEVREGSPH